MQTNKKVYKLTKRAKSGLAGFFEAVTACLKNNFLTRHPRATMVAALLLATGVFLTITLSKIGAWSVWFDESFSAFMIQQDWGEIWHYTALDINAPLYYFVLKVWSLIVGNSDIALRLLSVLLGVGVLFSGFALARRLFGAKIGYLTLLFLTLSPILLRYATEMRCYTLLIFLLILATHVFVLANQKPSRKLWLLYGFLIAAAMWTHYYAALPILAHWVWRAIMLRKKFFTRGLVESLIFAAILFLPWLPVMLRQLSIVQANGSWIPSFGSDTIGNFLGETMAYTTHSRTGGVLTLGLTLALILLISLLVQTRQNLTKKLQPNFLLLLLIVLLPPITLAILSMPPLRPTFINRYVIFSMVMFSFLVALAVGAKLKSPKAKVTQAALLISMLALSGWGVRNVLYFGNYNFDTNAVSMAQKLMSEIDSASSEKTSVIAETPWIFYDANVYATNKNPVYFLDSRAEYEYSTSLAMLQADTTHKIFDLSEFAQKDQKVWFLSSSETASSPPIENWELLRTITVTDPIDGHRHNALEYLVKQNHQEDSGHE
ncbi:MAG: glycosyltransferase family 39 protein [Candidatus Nomurabacteria bacterium]|nr:glycosyltransferase family 39 protein [Candidatus Nomurabacteria bacterium]